MCEVRRLALFSGFSNQASSLRRTAAETRSCLGAAYNWLQTALLSIRANLCNLALTPVTSYYHISRATCCRYCGHTKHLILWVQYMNCNIHFLYAI
ncbi:hypothetical protein AMTR_s00018p00193730 [Amborella trichopoda]|uniref:Uncharacterized protein n=1 Tax=Amborella trichopoda TaxID=13333 RepID=W1PKN4_AMBTC|nr:hypothetical protein AMTR_s00018p00193730 [Amborella trichopoda]